jgi:dTDP-4-amino-4,6-dideoxygalactose transaminase
VALTEDEITETLANVERVLRSGRLMLGPFTELFEEEFGKYTGCEHAIAVNSGTSALEIAIRCSGLNGGHALVPTNTNFATAKAVVACGGDLEFYDSGLYPEVADIERRITVRTKMLIVVHIGGYISPALSHLRDLCQRRGIFLLEDAAHAHNSVLGERPAGSFGHAAAFSFFPTKVLTTGEGGMIVTSDAKIAALARQYRDQGKDSNGMHVVMGNSWRLTEMGAVLGLAQLRSFNRDCAYRHRMMRSYERALRMHRLLSFPDEVAGLKPSGYKCIALLHSGISRSDLAETLLRFGVQLGRPVYAVPLHRQPVFQRWVNSAYPVADEFCERHICLPLWRAITDKQRDAVVEGLWNVEGLWQVP